jgi:hypothetical protein
MLELDPGIRGREASLHLRRAGSALRVPRAPFPVQCLGVGNAAVQTLPPQDRQLDFRRVQPTPVLGRVMDLQLRRDPPRLRGLKGLLQRPRLCVFRLPTTSPMTVASG